MLKRLLQRVQGTPLQVTKQSAFRSRFGGLWIDRGDAEALLQRKIRERDVLPHEAENLRLFIKNGYVIFKGVVPHGEIDAYLALFEEAWKSPPAHIYAHCEGKVVPLSMDSYDKVAKVSDLHYYSRQAEQLVFPASVRRFLECIYERPAVVFQTMTLRKGSEEPLHTDTGPLSLTEPMSLLASWVALEDVREGAGALEFIPGSHRIPEVLNNGVTKAHQGDMGAYYRVLQETRKRCDEAGLAPERFMAKKGDVLIWAADLMHGGAAIGNRSLTRKSLVAHFMPLGAMPTFYDFSGVGYVPYRNGGWRLDRITV